VRCNCEHLVANKNCLEGSLDKAFGFAIKQIGIAKCQ
jgi:hypothetical protein